MYVELFGDNTQSGNYPAKVYLKLRHMSASHFRDGNGNIHEFRQKLGFFRTFEFNRFAITNTTKCNEETKKDNSKLLRRICTYSKLTHCKQIVAILTLVIQNPTNKICIF